MRSPPLLLSLLLLTLLPSVLVTLVDALLPAWMGESQHVGHCTSPPLSSHTIVMFFPHVFPAILLHSVLLPLTQPYVAIGYVAVPI